ncbi:hypothetical protein Clacol_009192 [Clathrus columnatus]|uniref:SET domain-containing protein n=1 Tax=Clathrus columnatus TaxID=1419009 RepID=A0AAV5AMH3_9AGAM|nr:hypothetical protein Clacol_009192 [Clathrus columnatus]
MSERQLLCLKILNHLPYLNTLPSISELRTSLHFNETELNLLRGSNLYGATLDRKKDWEAEWTEARQYMSTFHRDWHDAFTWDRYLTASTYISSRAFPSTLLSSNPSLLTTDSSYPVLLPGVDSLNHFRAHQVSWVVDPCPSTSTPEEEEPPAESSLPLQVTLVVHPQTPKRQELFNNYGPKPNAEFILGYGFSIANNPDDTLVLKIGGAHNKSSHQRWEIGRNAKGIQGLWDEMKQILLNMGDDDEEEVNETEICLEAADMLENMIQQKIDSLPDIPNEPPTGVRPEVFTMIGHYLEGQRDILNSVLDFAQKQQEIFSIEEE